ncbi:sensor domain-containing diguanylate cyclase [Chromohalobacter israelensis]|uniref:sensor domain-containing diguanylate cyclase n=1 Tax=Chromohalobacter israelensis TaxID=141390 RepID=UPI00265BFDF9|nr:diguanylate cyclase [Chromohalobacter salexigens]MDO0946495.1 diguanylate cyclase [Chromohalobacter salexigens]
MCRSRMPEAEAQEAERVAALHRLGIYETSCDPELNRLMTMIGELFDVPCAMINLIDRERTWCLASSSDLAAPPRREDSLCAFTVDHDTALFIEDMRDADGFREHPLVRDTPFIRAFAGERILSLSGHLLGTLCLVDIRPRVFDAESRQRLADLAKLVSLRLNQRLIDEQRHTADAMIDQQTQLLDHLPDGIVLLDDRRVVHYANADAQRLLGGASHDVKGCAFDTLVAQPEGHDFATASRTGSPLEIHALPRFQGFEALQLGDRASLVGTHQALQRLRSLVDAWPDGVLICDYDNLRIVEWNIAARRLLGTQASSLEGTRLPQWFLSGDRRTLQRRIRAELGEGDGTLRHNATLHNDTPVEVTLVPMQDASETSLIVVLRDRSPYLQHLRTVTRKLAKAEEMISQDALTGLLNRFGFKQAIDEFMVEAERGVPFALLIADIDHFKDINDTYGHQLGDEALKIVANRLAEQLRDGDAVARYGGEEFCMLMTVPEDRVVEVAERIRRTVAATPVTLDDGKELALTISIGATYHTPGLDEDSMFERADEALYEAKEYGRNRTVMLNAATPRARDEEE